MPNRSRQDWQNFLGFAREETALIAPVREIHSRTGIVRPYYPERLRSALRKTIEAVRGTPDPDLADTLACKAESCLREKFTDTSRALVEEVQDVLEDVLLDSGEKDLAKGFILYRAQHSVLRGNQKLVVNVGDTVEGYLSGSDWRTKENVTANYWLRNVYSEAIAEVHQNADFHLHDLSMLSGYCAGWSLRQLIEEGFGGVPEKIASRPGRHLSTLANQMVNFLGVLQNEWAGAEALSSFDTYLAPFVKVDSLGRDETRQCLQSFIFGVNTPVAGEAKLPLPTLRWRLDRPHRSQGPAGNRRWYRATFHLR